jgi:hypothetical protein
MVDLPGRNLALDSHLPDLLDTTAEIRHRKVTRLKAALDGRGQAAGEVILDKRCLYRLSKEGEPAVSEVSLFDRGGVSFVKRAEQIGSHGF